jgi:hypothetical protein
VRGYMKKAMIALVVVMLGVATLACSLFTAADRSGALVFSPDKLPEGQVGQVYTAVVTLSHQRTPAFGMSAGEDGLPAGLEGSFDQDKQTYTINGTPTQAGTFSVTISAVCYGTNVSGQTGSQAYQLVIK